MKILFKKSLCCIAVLFFYIHGSGQKKDYLVKVNGDTLWGKIKLENKIFTVGDVEPTDISADQVKKIKSSRYRGSAVVRCNLQLYSDKIDDMQLSWIQEGTLDTVMILEEIYSTPKMNLYYGKSNFQTQFYFYKTPSDTFPIQLVVKYYLEGGLSKYALDEGTYRDTRSKVAIAEMKSYVNQLRGVMLDCNRIPEEMWELLSYRGYSFKQIIKRYNKCK